MTSGCNDEPVSHRFNAHGLSLHYVDWGNADAPLLLLVHGGADHCRSWDWVARQMRDDWHVVACDLRGHGDSDWSPDGAYNIEYLVADLAALVVHLGGAPVTIVGHSFGGAISLRYAGLFPEQVKRLAAVEGLAPLGKVPVGSPVDAEETRLRWRKWIAWRAATSPADITRRVLSSIEEGAERMQQRNPRLNAEQAAHLARWGSRQTEAGALVWKFDPVMLNMLPGDATDSIRAHIWEAIPCPVLLFHGKDSWASNPAEDGRVAHFRDARVVSLADAGHWVQHDRLDAFVAELKRFL